MNLILKSSRIIAPTDNNIVPLIKLSKKSKKVKETLWKGPVDDAPIKNDLNVRVQIMVVRL